LTEFSTARPADTTPPPPVGQCHHRHSIQTRNAA